jgi:hypothetical protein
VVPDLPNTPPPPHETIPIPLTMASADELKALGNKAIAEKNFDDAM